MHTAGNLTLTGYNSEYGNRSFEDKRTMRGGFAESPLHLNFAESPLHLNKGLGELPEWTEKTIITRAEYLANQGVFTKWHYTRIVRGLRRRDFQF